MATLDELSEMARQRMLAERAQRRAGAGSGGPAALPPQYRQSGAPAAFPNTNVRQPANIPYAAVGFNPYDQTMSAADRANAMMQQSAQNFMAQQAQLQAEIAAKNAAAKQRRGQSRSRSTAKPKGPNAYEQYMEKVTAKRNAAAQAQQERLDQQRGDAETQRQFDERMRIQQEYQQAQDEARQANETRYQDIMADYGDSRSDAARRYDDATQNIDSRYTAARDETARLSRTARDDADSRYQASTDDIDQRYSTARDALGRLTDTARQDSDARYGARQTEGINRAESGKREIDSAHADRYDKGMALLKNAGMQERADIAQGARNAQSAVGQNMVQRGLSGSTIAPTLMAGVQRDRYAEEGRLNERLRGEEAATHANLSGDRIGANERANSALNQIFAQLSGDTNAAADRLVGNNIAGQTAMLQNQTGAAIANNANRNQTLTGMDQNNIAAQMDAMNRQTGSAIANDANRNQVLTGLDSDRRNFMERREDEYPDLSILTNTMGNLAQTGGTAPAMSWRPITNTSKPAKKPSKKPVMGGWASPLTIPRFARGGTMPYNGYAMTGEQGIELGMKPGMKPHIYGANGPEISPVPRGTRIFNNQQTIDFLRNRPPGVPQLPMPKPPGQMPVGAPDGFTFPMGQVGQTKPQLGIGSSNPNSKIYNESQYPGFRKSRMPTSRFNTRY